MCFSSENGNFLVRYVKFPRLSLSSWKNPQNRNARGCWSLGPQRWVRAVGFTSCWEIFSSFVIWDSKLNSWLPKIWHEFLSSDAIHRLSVHTSGGDGWRFGDLQGDRRVRIIWSRMIWWRSRVANPCATLLEQKTRGFHYDSGKNSQKSFLF